MALLADPVNFAIAQREVIKRRASMVTPPIPKPDGGFMFLRTLEWPPSPDSEPDPLAEVFETPEGWVVFFEGIESEPKASLKSAIDYAKDRLTSRGHTVIDEVPWEF